MKLVVVTKVQLSSPELTKDIGDLVIGAKFLNKKESK